jgi:predicted nucleotidyltransferase
MCTQSEAIAILGEAFERSKAVFGNSLVNAYLYGSFARGDYDDESDVDILLTVDKSDSDIRLYNKSLAKIDSDLSLDHNITVTVTVKSVEQFNLFAEISPFYRNVINEGICYAGR